MTAEGEKECGFAAGREGDDGSRWLWLRVVNRRKGTKPGNRRRHQLPNKCQMSNAKRPPPNRAPKKKRAPVLDDDDDDDDDDERVEDNVLTRTGSIPGEPRPSPLPVPAIILVPFSLNWLTPFLCGWCALGALGRINGAYIRLITCPSS